MGIGNKIRKKIAKFDPISLDQMDKVRLMRRTDLKFVFNLKHLPELLKMATDNYFMVEIKDEREQIYKTTYFDTDDYRMYQLHHNGKLNRHKIRIRKYIYTKQEFLEVKRKNNRGETIKNRIEHETEGSLPMIYENSNEFIHKYTPYDTEFLIPTLGNRFIRLTLVNKDFTERITLDYKLKFTDLKNKTKTKTPGICIAEIKKNRDDNSSAFISYLKALKIQSMGFSKYCLGMALLNPDVKNNLFKQKLRTLEKV